MLKSAKGIGELIYYYRLVKNLSQQDLAEKLHVTVSAISSWERGINKPGIDVAAVLADEMGMTLDDFFRTKEKVNSDTFLQLNQTFAFEKAFLKIKRISLNPKTENLHIKLSIWGVSIDKESLAKTFNADFYCNQRKCKVTFKEIHVMENGPSTLSPEFKSLPSLAKRFEISQELDYQLDHDLEIKAQFMDEEAVYFIPGVLIRTIIKGPLFNIHDPEQTLPFLKAPHFKMALEYYSNIDDYQGLQDYLVNLFEQLKKYLKPL